MSFEDDTRAAADFEVGTWLFPAYTILLASLRIYHSYPTYALIPRPFMHDYHCSLAILNIDFVAAFRVLMPLSTELFTNVEPRSTSSYDV